MICELALQQKGIRKGASPKPVRKARHRLLHTAPGGDALVALVAFSLQNNKQLSFYDTPISMGLNQSRHLGKQLEEACVKADRAGSTQVSQFLDDSAS